MNLLSYGDSIWIWKWSWKRERCPGWWSGLGVWSWRSRMAAELGWLPHLKSYSHCLPVLVLCLLRSLPTLGFHRSPSTGERRYEAVQKQCLWFSPSSSTFLIMIELILIYWATHFSKLDLICHVFNKRMFLEKKNHIFWSFPWLHIIAQLQQFTN